MVSASRDAPLEGDARGINGATNDAPLTTAELDDVTKWNSNSLRNIHIVGKQASRALARVACKTALPLPNRIRRPFRQH